MTLEEAQALAREVIANKTRSHVGAAKQLAEFVLQFDGSIELEIEDWIRSVSAPYPYTPEHWQSAHASGVGLDTSYEADKKKWEERAARIR